MTTRTAARQSRPYPPLLEATASQSINDWSNLSGTIVGFRSPDYAQGISVPGFHLHFIDHHRNRGGHGLDFILAEVTLRVDVESDLHLEFPRTLAFARADLNGHDATREIAAAEIGPAN